MPETALSTTPGPIVLTVLAVSVLLAAIFGFRALRKRRRKDIDRRLRAACRGVLANFVIPDGNGAHIQVQYAVLTPRGILVLDIKDVAGHVFGSEAMQDWTVIAQDRRFTFANPQPGLWDRVAAVKRLAPEIPVIGFVAFTDSAQFTKGQPRSVTMLEPLLQDLEREHQASAETDPAQGFMQYWEKLREAAISARMDHLIRGSRA